MANGTPANLALAEKVLAAVPPARGPTRRIPTTAELLLDGRRQPRGRPERSGVLPGNAHPHAAALRRPTGRTPAQSVLAAIRLGLDEIRRLDVLVAYSNITALDVLNTCLGGELLGDAAIAQQGYTETEHVGWRRSPAAPATPWNTTAPPTPAVSLRALALLAGLVQDADTRIRARAFRRPPGRERCAAYPPWHRPLGHAPQPGISSVRGGGRPPEIERVQGWLADGTNIPPE